MQITNNMQNYQKNKSQRPSFGAIFGKTKMLESAINGKYSFQKAEILEMLAKKADEIRNIKSKNGEQVTVDFALIDEDGLLPDLFELSTGERCTTRCVDIIARDPKNPDSKELRGTSAFHVEGGVSKFVEGLINGIKGAVNDIGPKKPYEPSKSVMPEVLKEEVIPQKPTFSFNDILNKINGND